MSNDSVVKLIQPGTFNDLLTDVLRNGARALLTQGECQEYCVRAIRG